MENYKLKFKSLKGKEVNLQYDDAKHQYFIDGVRADGVTTALSVIDKSGPLIYWAVNKMAIPFLKDTIKPGVIYDEVQLMNIFTDASRQHTKKKDEAAGVGTLAHDWVERWIKHRINEQFIHDHRKESTIPALPHPEHALPPEMPTSPLLRNAVQAFMLWEKEHSVIYHHSEKKVCHPKYGYAGTLDFEATIDGELSIGDLKTSNGIYDEYRFQIAAYLAAREAETGKKYKARWCVRIGKETKRDKDGNEMVEFEAKRYDTGDDQKKDFAAFISALTLCRRLKELRPPRRYE